MQEDTGTSKVTLVQNGMAFNKYRYGLIGLDYDCSTGVAPVCTWTAF